MAGIGKTPGADSRMTASKSAGRTAARSAAGTQGNEPGDRDGNAPVTKPRCEQLACFRQPASQGSFRNPEPVGHVATAEPVDFKEDDRHPEVVR